MKQCFDLIRILPLFSKFFNLKFVPFHPTTKIYLDMSEFPAKWKF